jgi:LDH2 family malate/lactate/ureidoglycolate dehydrogenase
MWKVAHDGLLLLGVDEQQAVNGANVLNESDVRGIESHGINRLSHYEKLLRIGKAKVDPKVKILTETPVSAVLDTDHGLGICNVPQSMDIAMAKAKEHGVGICTVVNMTHCGIQGYYPIIASRSDMIGFCFVMTGPNAPAWGGKGTLLGNSPHSIAFPAGHTTPSIMYDMATTVVAGGKVELAQLENKPIPDTWLFDDEGYPTTDPFKWEHRKHGALQLMGGVKGYCLTVMVELFGGILSGCREGAFMMAIDPTIFRPLDDLKKDLDDYFYMIKNSPKRSDCKEIFLPGEIEYNNTVNYRANGIPLRVGIAEEVLDFYKRNKGIAEDATIEDLFLK